MSEEKEKIVLCWRPSEISSLGYTHVSLTPSQWESFGKEASEYHFLMNIDCPVPNRDTVVEGMVEALDTQISIKRQEVKGLEDKKQQLLSIEHKPHA
tara:strand:- start:467 stop:757 length:291 start_codon:yes stop_codon:yes gene_type:complete